jgi:hypothetical protein
MQQKILLSKKILEIFPERIFSYINMILRIRSDFLRNAPGLVELHSRNIFEYRYILTSSNNHKSLHRSCHSDCACLPVVFAEIFPDAGHNVPESGTSTQVVLLDY